MFFKKSLQNINKIYLFNQYRRFNMTNTSSLKNKLKELIPEKQKILKDLKYNHGNKTIDLVTVNQTIGGMRGIKSMLWNTSLLDPEKGITFHNKTINDLREELPKYDIKNSNYKTTEPSCEALLWFLMSGTIPSHEEVNDLHEELYIRSGLSDSVKNAILKFPKNTHPMTQFSSSILLLQNESLFAKKYKEGITKNDYWDYIYEDIMNLIAKLPEVTSLIYNNTYKYGEYKKYDSELDYAGNFCNMIGFNNNSFNDLIRLYILIHSDHEGGNASAHTCRLVGSTLSDPYLSLSASMNALAGPLHGLANQEVLKWLLNLQSKLKNENKEVNEETIKEFAWETLNNGQVIPGYGHAVLRNTDPRYTCQREFALKNLPEDELFKLVDTIYKVVPDVLLEHGKTKNPYPNVDSHSGVLLKHYGLNEYEYYTVLFGLGRSFGVLSELFWDRALNLPLERPKSVTLNWLENNIKK
tara:strand:+ start:965 stop:2371 length:1407 start_codon:yes stop_codon:yes gene_type:complete